MARILMVLTSHDELGDTGRKTGFWLEEFAAPYYVFLDAGHDVTLASPKGGQPPIDPVSSKVFAQTDSTRRFDADEAAQQALASTTPLATINADDFDVVFYPGGHGPLWDLTNDADSARVLRDTAEAGRPLGLVCHAPGVLHTATTSTGASLIAGREVTGFTNTEEEQAGLTKVVPYLVEDSLEAAGATFRRGADNESFVVTDGTLVTGQNPASSAATAEALLGLLDR